MIEYVTRRYARAFADEFSEYAQSGIADLCAKGFSMALVSPDFFVQRGFRIAERAD